METSWETENSKYYYKGMITAQIKLTLIEIKYLYKDKAKYLIKFLEEVEREKYDKTFDLNELYELKYAFIFASIGGKISGKVRELKSSIIIDLLEYLTKNHLEMNSFTLKMYQSYSKEVFGSSPSQKKLLSLLNKEISLDKKLETKRRLFKHSHVSKISFSNILGDDVNEEIREVFDKYYCDFKHELELLRQDCKSKEKEVRLILKASKENKKEE